MRTLIYLMLILANLNIAFSQWKPGDNLIDERDGQTYKTVKIGDQVWMAENLNIGNIIPTTKQGYEMSDNGVIEKYCWDNDVANCNGSDGKMKRGGFYEWMEAMQYWNGQPQLPVQGICPMGWHIPSNSEWNELFAFTGVGSTCTQLLKDGNSGFNAFLTGYRCTQTGSFRVSAMSADTRTYFWTAEQTDINNSPVLEFGQNSIQSFSYLKSLGLCVRCIWDGPASDIKENSESNGLLEIEILPNPSTIDGKVIYKLHGLEQVNVEIKIVDLFGNEVVTLNNSIISPGEYSFELSEINLISGTYFIIAKTNRKVVRNQFSVLN